MRSTCHPPRLPLPRLIFARCGKRIVRERIEDARRSVSTLFGLFWCQARIVNQACHERGIDDVMRHGRHGVRVLGRFLPVRDGYLHDKVLEVLALFRPFTDVRRYERCDSGDQHAAKCAHNGNPKREGIHYV